MNGPNAFYRRKPAFKRRKRLSSQVFLLSLLFCCHSIQRSMSNLDRCYMPLCSALQAPRVEKFIKSDTGRITSNDFSSIQAALSQELEKKQHVS